MEKEELLKNYEKPLTGYPSLDKPWLKYYRENVEKLANNIPKNKTAWDVIEEKLLEYYDVPALEFFGHVFSRQEFINLCYVWARTFRAMGVEENEVVPVYGPVVPDICAMVFGLNMIGACPYFLKLGISPQGLAEETKDSKIAVVYDGMWPLVAHEFSKDRFKKVIVASITKDMPSPKKEIVSFLSKIKSRKVQTKIPDDKKYICLDKAMEVADYYTGDVKVPFKENRPVVISSSSGTTVKGLIKGIEATNESIISQMYYEHYSDIPYIKGDKVLNHFPFTASTSLNSLFMYPLFSGMTVVIDPRVSNKDFYNQLTTIKPNIALTTGSSWECFFNRVYEEMQKGKKFDFSCAKGWSVGGEGTDVKKFKKWNEIMEQAGAYNPLFSGYGMSEVFAGASVDNPKAKPVVEKQIISVGIPEAGMVVKVCDEVGNELKYNQRGELWIKSQTAMRGYYNKPELTTTTKIDGWIRTGDLAEIDEHGLIYVWGRKNDLVPNSNVYYFDIANQIKSNEFINDAVILRVPTTDNDNNLVAHIVWNESVKEENKKELIELLNDQIQSNYSNISVSAYYGHELMLPYSATTLKKDFNLMSKQTTGYVQVVDGMLQDVTFTPTEDGKYILEVSEKGIEKKLTKK